MERIIKTNTFYGNEVSNYGIKNGRVDYRTLSKCFDAVLQNGIMRLTYSLGEWEMINGVIDNSAEIKELEDKISELQEHIEYLEEQDDAEDENSETYTKIEDAEEEIDEITDQIYDLQNEMDNNNCDEIFQEYIIDWAGAKLLMEWTDDPVFYNDYLDMYVWGVTHYGTSWDYVLTDIKIEKD